MEIKNSISKGLLVLVFCVLAYSLYQINTSKSAPEAATLPDTLVVSTSHSYGPKSMLEDSIVNFALKYLGTPYVYGACSKDGFDCSGFVYFVFKNFDIEVPRSSSQYETFGKTISLDKVRQGDILVFLSPTRNEIGHIGIVTKTKGNSIDFIHASSGREMKVILSDMSNSGYKKRFIKAVRVL